MFCANAAINQEISRARRARKFYIYNDVVGTLVGLNFNTLIFIGQENKQGEEALTVWPTKINRVGTH